MLRRGRGRDGARCLCQRWSERSGWRFKPRDIDCERLLLPLGRNGNVEQIVASLQLISLEGEFRRDSVLEAFDAHISVAFAGMIAGGGGLPHPGIVPGDGAP